MSKRMDKDSKGPAPTAASAAMDERLMEVGATLATAFLRLERQKAEHRLAARANSAIDLQSPAKERQWSRSPDQSGSKYKSPTSPAQGEPPQRGV